MNWMETLRELGSISLLTATLFQPSSLKDNLLSLSPEILEAKEAEESQADLGAGSWVKLQKTAFAPKTRSAENFQNFQHCAAAVTILSILHLQAWPKAVRRWRWMRWMRWMRWIRWIKTGDPQVLAFELRFFSKACHLSAAFFICPVLPRWGRKMWTHIFCQWWSANKNGANLKWACQSLYGFKTEKAVLKTWCHSHA